MMRAALVAAVAQSTGAALVDVEQVRSPPVFAPASSACARVAPAPAEPPVRACAPQKRASRARARVIARANADDVNRRSFIRRAGFAALSLTVATPEEVRERNDARS